MTIIDLGFADKSKSEIQENLSPEDAVAAAETRALALADAPETLDVAAVLTKGAEAAPGAEVEPGFPATEEKKRRGRPKGSKNAAAMQTPNELEVFFSPTGIGQLWVNGWNAFYRVCEAAPFSPEEEAMHKNVFAQWCKHRLPASASKYQPDLLLAACVAMATLPRLNPVAKTTAPVLVRFVKWVGSWFKRKKE